jgi:hypothetical protein
LHIDGKKVERKVRVQQSFQYMVFNRDMTLSPATSASDSCHNTMQRLLLNQTSGTRKTILPLALIPFKTTGNSHMEPEFLCLTLFKLQKNSLVLFHNERSEHTENFIQHHNSATKMKWGS